MSQPTHPIKEAEIMLGAAAFKWREYPTSTEVVELIEDAEENLTAWLKDHWLKDQGFDAVGNPPNKPARFIIQNRRQRGQFWNRDAGWAELPFADPLTPAEAAAIQLPPDGELISLP